jgi:serine/threonine protein kinase
VGRSSPDKSGEAGRQAGRQAFVGLSFPKKPCGRHLPPLVSCSVEGLNALTQRTMIRRQFRLREKLSDALFGDVWMCEDALDKDAAVAMKVVSLAVAQQALAENPYMDNPWNERETIVQLARLGPHPHLLNVRQEFVHRGAWFVVMEYCEGGDLWNLLQGSPGNRLVESDAMHVFRQVVSGVRFLHRHGIAHRDLSLENVFLRHGVCKVADFGLSTSAHQLCNERVGKGYYMAPEVVVEQLYEPAAADMWSLGIMLFIMLTGSPLTPSASDKEKAFNALRQFGVREILAAWRMDALVSESAMDLLENLLQIEPSKRLTIEEVAAHPALARS